MTALQAEFSWTAPGALEVEFDKPLFQSPLVVVCESGKRPQADALPADEPRLLKHLITCLARSGAVAVVKVCSQRKLHFEIISGDLLEGVEGFLYALEEACCHCGDFNDVAIVGRSTTPVAA
jgi:hypothetical protein